MRGRESRKKGVKGDGVRGRPARRDDEWEGVLW